MDVNSLFAGVTLPGWAVAIGAVSVLLALVLLLRPRSGEGARVAALGNLALVAVVAGGAYFGLKHFEEGNTSGERRALEERANNLLGQANQQGSVLGCLNSSASPVLDEACEKAIFAEPQRLATAVGNVTERLKLLNDVAAFAQREPDFADRFEVLRRSLETDTYGLVAHVLATENKCIPDSCARFRLLKDTEKVKANLTSRRFDTLLAKYSPGWTATKPEFNISDMQASPPVYTIGGRANENELPTANTAIPLPQPNGQTSTTPIIVPPVPGQQQPPVANQQPPVSAPQQPPASNAATPPPSNQPAVPTAEKKKATKSAQPKGEKKQQQQVKRKERPEPVGGLPRVTARGSDPPAADDDEGDSDSPPPPPRPQRR